MLDCETGHITLGAGFRKKAAQIRILPVKISRTKPVIDAILETHRLASIAGDDFIKAASNAYQAVGCMADGLAANIQVGPKAHANFNRMAQCNQRILATGTHNLHPHLRGSLRFPVFVVQR